MGILCIFCCIFIIASTMHVENINIDLEPFNQSECITNCKHGLTAKLDRLILIGHVEIKESFKQKMASVSFQWKKRARSNYADLQIIYFDQCTDIKRNDEITCTKSKNQKLYHIFLNVTAYEELSQAMMILKVFVDGLEVESKYIVLPTIHTLTEIEMNNWISVWLEPFNQKDCITSCDTGLLADVDYLSLKAQVVFSEPLRKESVTASFQWKNETNDEYEDLKIIHLNQCSGFVDDDIYCTSSNSGMEYTIYLNMTANELLSERKIAMNVVVGAMNKKSMDIVLPKILRASYVKLNLNGKQLNTNNRTFNYNFNGSSSYLELCCESVIAPCYVIITPPEGPPVMEKTCARYESLQSTTYKLGFSICGVRDYQEHFNLHAHSMQFQEIDETSITFKIVVAVVCVIIGLLIGFFVFCFFKRRRDKYVMALNDYDNTDGSSSISVSESQNLNHDTLSQSSVPSDSDSELHSNSGGLAESEADTNFKKEIAPGTSTRAKSSQMTKPFVQESEKVIIDAPLSSKANVFQFESEPFDSRRGQIGRPSKKLVVEDKPGTSVRTRSASRKQRGAVTARKLNKAE